MLLSVHVAVNINELTSYRRTLTVSQATGVLVFISRIANNGVLSLEHEQIIKDQ